jgi:hypothetical protein
MPDTINVAFQDLTPQSALASPQKIDKLTSGITLVILLTGDKYFEGRKRDMVESS